MSRPVPGHGRQRVGHAFADEAVRSKVGTLAHNRAFSPAEWREYGLPPALLRRAERAGFLRRVGRGQYVPTVEGWACIEGGLSR